ncbi:acetamidase/formamidase family protein [Curtobacterium sp. MCSS17_015]|uniref:acetamidase/formamidase family protein n=1 Tax=Curtobacterium sp. MCSS17_015 TaxID=2175666 RepID=UPI000DAA107F|nr:acetamidase/formamidase family protein [Curtobacterium sp. MCSS17_015]WIB25618.1 acetamidase/formamidase family protein [Curtobacterium sp. MCSS17_015]
MTADHHLPNTLGRTGYAADREPVLTIAPGTGETIGFETTDAVYAELDDHHDMAQLQAPINPVTGPVYVEGAEPGDTLAVTIHDIELTTHGWSVSLPGSGALQHVMGDRVFTRRCPIEDGVVHVTDRHAFPVRPMIGCIGTAPADGENSTIMPAYAEGGNMDVTEARPGSTVYLPVRVPGALLSIGDIHAIMAEGESSFVAIEAQGTAVVSVDLVKGGPGLRAPRIETADEWLFVGLGEPVQESIRRGYEDAFAFLVEEHGWSGDDAYAVLSAVGDSKLGGPTGSGAPDPLHPFDAIGAVTLHRVPKAVLETTGTA